jgi:glycosyltransferase involved in cell wall biosynthesis
MKVESTDTLALIPAHNEAEHISEVVQNAVTYLTVLVLDDGSEDDTAILAQQSGAIVISQKPNQGKGAALKAGFCYAIDQGYQYILTLDGDGQHDPLEIPKFLKAKVDQNADLVVGARDFSQMPLVRRFANSTGRWLLSWALGQSIRDNQSGYRLVSTRLAEITLSSQESGFEFEVEMIVNCVNKGYILAWVPIKTIYAGEKSHISYVSHATNYLNRIWRIRRERMKSIKTARRYQND